VAREYEELKRTIAAQVVGADAESREQYAVAKSDFVAQAVAVALAQGYPANLSDR
jgi:flagellar biosynthesis/type III secretory pathway protein FliH